MKVLKMLIPISDLSKIPDSAGIYFICKDDEILYIGKSERLYRRITLNAPRLLLFKAFDANFIRLLLCNTEKSFSSYHKTEAKLIKQFKPILNIRGKAENQTKEERKIKRQEYRKNKKL